MVHNKNTNGFSLIEVLVVMGILSVLISGAFFIGFPEYNRYIISSKQNDLTETLLESRARLLASDEIFNEK